MQDNVHIEGRGHAAATKALSPDQIRRLILLAREAFAMEFPTDPDDSFDAWRHRTVMQVVERPGLIACRNEDYLPLLAHFLRMVGRENEANAAEARAATEPRTWALHALDEACRKVADVMPQAMAYAAGYIRRKRGCMIEDASDRDLWACVYMVKRKAAQLRKKAVTS
jgi:hypothetical protein